MCRESIEAFLVNGIADSIVTAELSNWNGKVIRIPRVEVADFNRKDVGKGCPDIDYSEIRL